MKKILVVVCCLAQLLSGCRERNTPIFVSLTPFTDATYTISPIPADSPHNVLMEEFSGQSCSNCPSAHAYIETLEGGGNVNAIVYYLYGPPQTIPNPAAHYDFRDSAADEIAIFVFGSSYPDLPSGFVDRTPVSGSILLYEQSWGGAVVTQKSIVDSMNLSVTSSYYPSSKIATIQARVAYLQNVSTQQNLSIVIVEDSMADLQDDNTFIDSNYLFTDVFRDRVSPYTGSPVLPDTTTKVAGRVYWCQYNYTLRSTSPAINPAHCRVIAFLNAQGIGSDYHVIQSAQCKFAP